MQKRGSGTFAHMREIAPGIWHWTARHPKIGIDVSSYWLPRQALLIDPLAVPEDVDRADTIVLTNRHHLRGAEEAAERLRASIHAPRSGMHEFEDGAGIEPYDPGDVLAGGAATVHEVGAICPDESALHVPAVSALAVADGVIRYGELGFVPDHYIDDPAETKDALKRAYLRLAEELEFDSLLTAHGEPLVGGARDALRDWASN